MITEIKQKTTEEKEIIKFQAADGEIFYSKEACQTYENHLTQVLLQKYKKIIRKTTTEEEMFDGWFGNEAIIETVKVDSQETAQLLIQLAKLHSYNECATNISRIQNALEKHKIIAIFRGFNSDCFVPMPLFDTWVSILKQTFEE